MPRTAAGSDQTDGGGATSTLPASRLHPLGSRLASSDPGPEPRQPRVQQSGAPRFKRTTHINREHCSQSSHQTTHSHINLKHGRRGLPRARSKQTGMPEPKKQDKDQVRQRYKRLQELVQQELSRSVDDAVDITRGVPEQVNGFSISSTCSLAQERKLSPSFAQCHSAPRDSHRFCDV